MMTVYRNYSTKALLFLLLAVMPLGGARADEPVRVGHVLGLRSPLMTKDYRIALELMMKRVFADFGVDIEVKGFDSPQQGLDAFWRKEIDVTEISSLDYALLPKDRREAMEIVGVVNLTESKFKKYSLLSAPGTTLEQLEGKPVTMIGRGEWNVGRRWLELELLERYGKTCSDFFGEISVIDYENPSEAILPAFFGKAKACLVMDHQTGLLAELNPQIGAKLKPVISSPDMLGVLFAVRSNYKPERIKMLQASTQKLHTTPGGQQAFTLMKVQRMGMVEDQDLDGMRKLANRMEARGDTAIASLPIGIDNEVAK